MKHVIFQLGTEEFGISVSHVHSIERLLPIRTVPLAPPHVTGIINLRGEVLVVVDLKNMLGMDSNSYSADARMLIVEHTAYLVDSASDIIDIDPQLIQPLQEANTLLRGVFNREGTLINILDESVLLRDR